LTEAINEKGAPGKRAQTALLGRMTEDVGAGWCWQDNYDQTGALSIMEAHARR